MDVDVLGRKGTVPEVLRRQARAKVAKLGRLTPVLEHAEVRLTEDGDAPPTARNLCEVTVEGRGHVLRARARASEMQVAVDLAVGKLEHQAERLKGKLVGRSHPRRSKAVLTKA